MPEITPEHAKLLHAKYSKSTNTTSQFPNPHSDDYQKYVNPNEETTSSSAKVQKTEAKEAQVQEPGAESNFRTGNNRRQSDSFDPNLRGPSRAQEQFSLRQSPTGFMDGVPRQKFQYVATLRFANDDTFEQVFKTAIDSQVETNSGPDQYTGPDAAWYDPNTEAFKNGLKIIRQNVIRNLRKDLIWNIKNIDGPKVNLQLDVLNQYNRKRNVYRTRQYDPINVTFYDTMNSTALNLWRYLYEYYAVDGRNKSKLYNSTSGKHGKRSPYGNTTLATSEQFTEEHNYGLSNSFTNDDYLIKSLDLFLIHGQKYTLIRFVHPKITGMDHDIFTYEASAPVELRMQFAYETVLYETVNHPFEDGKDMNVDLKDLFRTVMMPDTPTVDTRAGSTGGGEGSLKDDSYLTKMTGDMNLQDTLKAKSPGSGTNYMTANQRGDANIINKKSNGVLTSILGGSPISDAISKVSEEVYNITKGAVSSFGNAIGTSGNSFTNSTASIDKLYSDDMYASFGGKENYEAAQKKALEKANSGGWGWQKKDKNNRVVKNNDGNPTRHDKKKINNNKGIWT
tara:strand:+ start:846 stop:2537 length:1692 start_codon:yes stop_codon:yes gene_type:complete